jgi:alkylated DNA repair dioxygenase AlkB
MERINLSNYSWIDKGLLPVELANVNFEELWNLHPEKYNQVVMAGRVVNTPRWQQSYNKPYFFSGMAHEALPVPDSIRPYWDWANSAGYGEFNQILINWYANGHHYIGTHSDDESQLIYESPIISLSLGAERIFRLREKKSKQVVHDIPMPHGSVVVMGGMMQNQFTHEVPKINGIKGDDVGRRINITFRQFEN